MEQLEVPRTSLILSTTTVAAVLGIVVAPSIAYATSEPPTVTGTPLREVVAALPLADEVRDGYDRTKFRHWVDADADGCNTRAEVLLTEASTPPTTGPKCAIVGDSWYSAYDDTYITNARASDIDHMVPLAEAWDSGAYAWTPQQREAYANDLDEPRALIARHRHNQPLPGSPHRSTSRRGRSGSPGRTSSVRARDGIA